MCRIVLASQSPRRKSLLKIIFDDFLIIPDDSPENEDKTLSPEEYVLRLAEAKCMNVSDKLEGDYLVIGADTVVVKDNEILGKPSDEDNACEMLEALSNSIHSVYTGVYLYSTKNNIKYGFYEKTDVYFYNIPSEEIKRYVHTSEPMDKAGAYGIQEKGSLFVRKVDGDYNNVVGLPLARLGMVLKEKFGLRVGF